MANNTFVNLTLSLNCSSPLGTSSITVNTNYCPGTYEVAVSIGADAVSLNCEKTILQTNQIPLTISNRQNVMINDCIVDPTMAGIYGVYVTDNSKNITFNRLKFIGNSYKSYYIG